MIAERGAPNKDVLFGHVALVPARTSPLRKTYRPILRAGMRMRWFVSLKITVGPLCVGVKIAALQAVAEIVPSTPTVVVTITTPTIVTEILTITTDILSTTMTTTERLSVLLNIKVHRASCPYYLYVFNAGNGYAIVICAHGERLPNF